MATASRSAAVTERAPWPAADTVIDSMTAAPPTSITASSPAFGARARLQLPAVCHVPVVPIQRLVAALRVNG